MMYADLIDQEDLLSQLKALGFSVPPAQPPSKPANAQYGA